MKNCFKCGERKPLDQFYRHAQMADGHLNKCKDCTKRDVKQHRGDNIERVRAYDRERGNRQSPEYRKEYRKENPEKRIAHTAISNAVRDGRIWKSPCCMADDCYETKRLHGHHADYDQPLSVTWLCPAHHKQLHAEFDARHGTAQH